MRRPDGSREDRDRAPEAAIEVEQSWRSQGEVAQQRGMRAAQRKAEQCSAAAGLADVGASDSGGGGKNFLRRGSAWRPDELEPGYATPFRGRGERGKMRLLHGRPVREEEKIRRREQQKGARGGGVRGSVSQMLGTVPYLVVDLSSARAAMLVGSIS
ncbi:hypothetical protein TGAM01_v202494 [Trichoderma gamsii]|uniref:Uncharacterized protein n=1 Tax=Trichoderma gamsii TaxID=398673 RepID=A0A2P4ZWI1_9HYPO|nr:hypothetical protein TGAM01_v202494 [Trichoderma gamsii]PON28647.1 hypothetical protein TGAM01_v202494 [Trichoderma gamsii]